MPARASPLTGGLNSSLRYRSEHDYYLLASDAGSWVQCREIVLMAAVSKHARVLSVLAYCKEPPGIVMPLVVGGSLHAKMLERLRPEYGKLLEIAGDSF